MADRRGGELIEAAGAEDFAAKETQLRTEGWDVADPVWWQPERGDGYRPLDDDDAEALRARFAAR